MPIGVYERTQEHCKRISESRIGVKNMNWKGDNVSINTLHQWLNRNYPRKGICSICGKIGKTEYSNNSGEYLRDIKDYEELCRSCHSVKDDVGDRLNKKLDLDVDFLILLHSDMCFSYRKIGKIVGCSHPTVMRKLKKVKKHDI